MKEIFSLFGYIVFMMLKNQRKFFVLFVMCHGCNKNAFKILEVVRK